MMLVAMAIDLALGWPDRLYAAIGHPVTWIGALIRWMDQRFNHDTASDLVRRSAGVLTAVVVIGVAGGLAYGVQSLLPQGWPGIVLGGVLAWPFVALRSMHAHVAAVARPLQAGDLPDALHAVSMIVGRDPETLDEPAVCRAAIESLAENFSDGVVAPAFWYALFGLPGLFAYKMLNTADSMIGHKNAKYLDFGWASARLDDLANWPAARLSILFIAAGAGMAKGRAAARAAIGAALRDAGLHRSPNSGWPEAAMAGALGIGLAGPRIYGGARVDEPMMNASGRTVATAADIDLSLRIFSGACAVLALAVFAAAFLVALL